MRTLIIYIICFLSPIYAFSQGVGVNDDGSMPVAGTMLDIKGATDDNTTYGMQVKNSSGDAIMVVRGEGNVGIGTATPGSKLHVDGGNISVEGTLPSNVWGNVIGLGVSGSGSTTQGIIGHQGSHNLDIYWNFHRIAGGSTYTGLSANGFTSANAISLGNSGITFHALSTMAASKPTERMRITNDGNVGIGTTSPGGKLEINTAGLGLYLNQPSAADQYIRYHVPGVRWWTIGPKANGDFWFSNSSNHASSSPFMISSAGNVGIGTTSPAASLDVSGRTYKFSNDYITYSWNFGGSTDLNWKNIANITIGTGAYKAVSFEVNVTDAGSNYGASANGQTYAYNVSMRRSGPVQNDFNDAEVVGPSTEYVRAVKTSTGNYELQVRQATNWRHMKVEAKVTSHNNGVTIDYVDNPANGSTSGTIYTATAGSSGSGAGINFTPMTDGVTWYSFSLSGTAGGGEGEYKCSSISIRTITDPAVPAGATVALISFRQGDANQKSAALKVYNGNGSLIGYIGQAGRGGDGRSFYSGGMIAVHLNASKQFRVSSCRKDGDFATWYYTVIGYQ